jgi:Pyridoxamine 5'-phosphate oxidase
MPDNKADLGSPGGSASPGSEAGTGSVVEPLDEAECMDLLSTGRIGRLIYNGRYGPVAVPSEYKIHEGSIVFRTYQVLFTEEDLRTGIAHAEYQVAVEADQIDLEAREGWVVLVRGAAHHLDTEAERAPIIGAGLEPWIAGVPAHFIRVNPTSTWGNRIIRA